MKNITPHNTTATLDAKFQTLAFDLGDGDDGNFLSGWQCENPFVSGLLQSVRDKALTFDHRRYTYFDAHENLIQSILSHHEALDASSPQSVLCGCGTTSLLSTFAAYLQSIGVTKVYFIAPLYITLQTGLDRFGIQAIPISEKQPYEMDFTIELPNEKNSVLLLTDPVWYAGTAITKQVIAEIAAWQKDTESLVFVDGSLQYMPWSGPRFEASSVLDPKLTIRLVCPSKQLSIHGYRFSYMLVPSLRMRGLAWAYTNIFGPAPLDSVAFGHEAIQAIKNGEIPAKLMVMASSRYNYMIAEGDIETVLSPHCGYFVFAKVVRPLSADYLRVDGSYFAQDAYPDYIKLNLLSPSIELISSAYMIGDN